MLELSPAPAGLFFNGNPSANMFSIPAPPRSGPWRLCGTSPSSSASLFLASLDAWQKPAGALLGARLRQLGENQGTGTSVGWLALPLQQQFATQNNAGTTG